MLSVIKSTWEKEPFSEEKIKTSLRRARVPEDVQEHVLSQVTKTAYDEMPTSKIRHEITSYLSRSHVPFTRSLYNLKQAILQLGPTGYPFEDFLSELYTSFHYTTRVRQIIRGTCVSHEIDVIAMKDASSIMIEAKFHNDPSHRSDLHVSMYTKARFDDVKDRHGFTQAWIVTNTKATTDAIAFAECAGLSIISWGYPKKGNLQDLIEEAGLHPITMLTTLPASLKVQLINKHIVRCKHLHEDKSIIQTLPLSKEEKTKYKLRWSLFVKGNTGKFLITNT
jgi:hypothetical protein